MGKPTDTPIELPFSAKYDRHHAEHYYNKHRDGLARRVSNWRDMQLARKALAIAGDPTLVLDLPCGAGRFWPVLSAHPDRVIIAADNSADMLEVARTTQPPQIVSRVRTMQTSAFGIDLPAESVDNIFCMRLLHHVGESANRLAILREFHRVSRDSVILSLWVDGNYMSWKRKRLERRRNVAGRKSYQNRFVLPADVVEKEFSDAGFRVTGKLDFLPLHSMWRVYVLNKR